MKEIADSILTSLSAFEKHIAGKGKKNLQSCLRLGYLCMMSAPYLNPKLNREKILELAFAKYYAGILPEVFAGQEAELKKNRTKECKVVAALSKLNDNWPDEMFNEKFALYKEFAQVQPLLPQMDELFQTVGRLDKVERDNLLSSGEHENDTAHIIKLCIWLALIYPHLKTEVALGRLLEIALLHDLAEARSGDLSLSAQITDPGLKLEKKRKELEAIMYYRVSFPAPFNNIVYNAFEEYEARETPETQIVWIADKLDANWQANRYNDGDVRYWADCPNGEVYYRLALEYKPQIAELNEPVLIELEKQIIALSEKNIKKCGIKLNKVG